ncbi:MAG: hypothetical protein LUH36_09150 [Oscillospiraceae bacterium]|nr:hypothetical protein [Oscillospiraceae bacterium]
MEIPMTLISDEKGYIDRECPNKNCMFTFKINLQDWEEKVSDEEVHCPMCGFVGTSDQWWTQHQLESIRDNAANYAVSMITAQLDDAFRNFTRSTRKNKYVKITYKPGKRITFQNNPIGQSEEWETDITCEKCGTRYSVVGSAYFCPCCGYNSAVSVFEESVDNIGKMLDSIPEMKLLLTKPYGKDKAETMCRGLLEGSIGDIVSAFQKFASCYYDKLTGKVSRVNDFQIVDKGSKLFQNATGKGYSEWLSEYELQKMNLMFQRRHLIEHNNGMVDQKYIEKSGDTSYVVGQRLVVKKSDVLELLTLTKKLAKGLMTLQGEFTNESTL